FLFLDSGREGLWGHFNSAFPGKILAKKFYINYTQQSVKKWRDERCPSGSSLGRGVLNLSCLEACLIAAGKNLPSIIGNRDNKYHGGSCEVNVISGVSKVNPSALTKIATSVKLSMLADSQVKDSARSRATARDDGHDREPMAWAPLGHGLMSELVHRFRPKSVTLFCASDPVEILPILECKIPVVAFCHSDEHATWFRKVASSCVFKSFINPQSKLYKPEVAKLLVSEDGEGGCEEEDRPSNEDG
ncbi:unnamed protein product, partial [Durusdinium trenchii]